jgi:hypothetical protein
MKGRNCILRGYKEEAVYWTGIGWSEDREKAARYSIADAENLQGNMRDDDEMAYWERYDKSRSAL